jgi:undecaprenyl-diphosphatase
MIARGFALLGAGLPAVVIALLAAVLVWGRRGAWWAIVLLAACLVDEGEVRLLKTIAHRMRPDVMFGSASAFPSGHTAFAALLGTVLLLLLPALATRVAVPLLVAGMAWSRTELHAHWLTDVVAGAALGAATAVLVVALAVRVARALPAERLQRPGVELLRRRRAVGR